MKHREIRKRGQVRERVEKEEENQARWQKMKHRNMGKNNKVNKM
jgi:hypothetical protein